MRPHGGETDGSFHPSCCAGRRPHGLARLRPSFLEHLPLPSGACGEAEGRPHLLPTALVLTALGAWREGGRGGDGAQVWSCSSSGKGFGGKSRDPRVCTFFIKKLEASGSEPVPTQDMLERTLLHPWEGEAGPQDSTAAGLGAEG